MKFSCHRCKTRYSIADDKVRGKILKVRCKKCSELIVVRERTLTSPNELERGGSGLLKIGRTPHPSAPPPPPSAAETDWFYAVDGRTEGPLLQSRLIALLKEEGIPRGAHAWREGMGVWRPMSEIEEFAAYVPEAMTVPPPPPPPGAPTAPGPLARSVSSVAAPPAFGAPSPTRPPPPATPPVDPGRPAPHTNGRSPFDESAQSLPSLESLADLEGEGPATLPNHAKSKKTVPPPAAPMGGIGGPQLAQSAPRQRIALVDEAEVRRKLMLYALPAILVAILLAIVLAVVYGDDEADAPIAAITEIVPTPEELEEPATIALEEEELELTFEDGDVFSGAAHRKKKVKDGGKRSRAGRRRSAGELDKEGVARAPADRRMRLPPGSFGGGGMVKTESSTDRLRTIGRKASQGHLPKTLGGPEIMAVIKQHRRGLKGCLERHLKREGADSVGNKKVTISWKVSGSGRASAIKLSHGMSSSVFGNCVKGQLKNWSFPRHRGAPIPVKYPVILTASP